MLSQNIHRQPANSMMAPAVDRPQHKPRLRRRHDGPQGQPALVTGKSGAGDGQTYGDRSAAPDSLDYPRPYNPLQAGGHCHQGRPDAEHYQRSLVDPGIAVHVGQATCQRHRGRVAQ